MSEFDFASILCSRLCHDLVSPVGALTNGVELLGEESDPAMREQCLQLLADSARQTSSKLKFFRLAFGAAGSYDSLVDMREVQSAIEGMFSTAKVKLDWHMNMKAMTKIQVKVFMNMALLAGEALLRGGTLTLAAESNADQTCELVVRAEGPRTLLSEDLRKTLLGEIRLDTVDARTVPAYVIYTLVSQSGTLHVSPAGEATVVIGAHINKV